LPRRWQGRNPTVLEAPPFTEGEDVTLD
jgi:hypothetical protein